MENTLLAGIRAAPKQINKSSEMSPRKWKQKSNWIKNDSGLILTKCLCVPPPPTHTLIL